MEIYIKDMALSKDFNRGKSAKLFKKVHDTKQPLRVTRNSIDYVVILGFEEYKKMVEKINFYESNKGVRKK